MSAGPLWGEEGPENFAESLLKYHGIAGDVVGKHFQVIISHPKDPCLIRGIVGSVQVSLTWVEVLFSPPFHTVVPQAVGSDCVLRGMIGWDGIWVALLSKWHTPLGEVYPSVEIYPSFPPIDFKILL